MDPTIAVMGVALIVAIAIVVIVAKVGINMRRHRHGMSHGRPGPPMHRFTSRALSDCHKLLIARTLMVIKPASPRNYVKKVGGSSVVRLVGD